MRTRIKGLSGLVLALAVMAPISAFAHAKLVTPKPRTDDDGIKTGPCGVARTATATQYAPGQTVMVTWREGIDHAGCFDVMFSQANDQNWVRLARIADDGGTPNRNYGMQFTMPNTPCNGCTLALRQIMLSSAGMNRVCNATDPDSLDGGAPTYYSCADIQLVAGADGGTVGTPGSSSSSSSSGSTTSSGGTTTLPDGGTAPGDGDDDGSGNGAAPNLSAGKGDDCSVGWGVAPSASAFLLGMTGLVGLARRRRARR